MNRINKDIAEASHVEFNNKKFFKLRYIDESVPEPVVYQLCNKYVGNLSLQDLDGDTETFDILIKDIIVEYNSDTSVKKVDISGKTYSYTYLTTYVPIGIPTSTYNWILKMATKNLSYGIECCSRNKNSQYTWISAGLLSNKTINCTAYRNNLKSTVLSGNFCDIMLRSKSNIFGHGNFRIKMLQKQDYKILHFILNDFQIIQTTDIYSAGYYPVLEDEVSDDLLKLFID